MTALTRAGREEISPTPSREMMPTGRIHAHEVGGVEAGGAEELPAALGLERGQGAQDDAGGCLGDAADRRQLILALLGGQEGDDRAQVGQVHELQALAVRPREDQLEGLLLRRVQGQGACQQDRAEVGDLGAHGHARELRIRAAQAQQLNREGRGSPRLPVGGRAGQKLLGARPGLGQARQVALDVAQEHGRTRLRQALGQELEGTGLARARRARDQEVTVKHGQGHLGADAGHARAVLDQGADRDRGDVPRIRVLNLGSERGQLARSLRGRGLGRLRRGRCGLGRGGGCRLGGGLGRRGGFLGGRCGGVDGGASGFKLCAECFGLRAGGFGFGGLGGGFGGGQAGLEILDVLAHGDVFRAVGAQRPAVSTLPQQYPLGRRSHARDSGAQGCGPIHRGMCRVAAVHRGRRRVAPIHRQASPPRHGLRAGRSVKG